MNLTAVITASLLVVAPSATAIAAVVDPYEASIDYCSKRDAGLDHQQALRFAIMSNIDHSEEETYLDDGSDFDIELYKVGVELLCPEHSSDK